MSDYQASYGTLIMLLKEGDETSEEQAARILRKNDIEITERFTAIEELITGQLCGEYYYDKHSDNLFLLDVHNISMDQQEIYKEPSPGRYSFKAMYYNGSTDILEILDELFKEKSN